MQTVVALVYLGNDHPPHFSAFCGIQMLCICFVHPHVVNINLFAQLFIRRPFFCRIVPRSHNNVFLQLGLLFWLYVPGSIFDRSFVPVRPQTTNHRLRLVAEIAVMPKCFALMDIADVHFDERNFHACKCISQSYTCVGERSRIYDDGIDIAPSFVYPIY
jgi:hypothetical protein